MCSEANRRGPYFADDSWKKKSKRTYSLTYAFSPLK